MKKTILFVTPGLGYGGAPKMLAALANYLAQQGDETYLLTYENNVMRQPIDDRLIQIKCKKNYKIRGVRRFLQLLTIRRIVHDKKPDVVISFADYPNLLTLLATVGTKVPVIVSERGNPYSDNKGKMYKFTTFMYQFADGIVFQTEKAKNFFKSSIREKSTVIPNPVMVNNLPDRWTGNRKDEIVSVGRFELVTKRQDIMLKAFKDVITKYPNIKLVFYGDGKDKVKIQNIVADLGLMEHVIFAGVTDNVYESIRYSRLFVLSSDSEGIPNALIEAMSVGLPCISTDCSPGGARLLIDNRINGIVVPCGDADALAQAMIFLLDDDKKSEEFGIEAMKIIEKFEPAKIFKVWNTYIDKIIRGRGLV